MNRLEHQSNKGNFMSFLSRIGPASMPSRARESCCVQGFGRDMQRVLSLCIAAFAGALFATMPAFAAPVFAITGPSTVLPGESLRLNIAASGLTDLYAYQLDVTFNPAVFKATSVSEGSFLSTSGSTFFDGGVTDNITGTISIIFDTLIGPGFGASGSGVLAQLAFDVKGPLLSAGNFQIANVIALDSSFNSIGVASRGISVAVPEPSALALTLAALSLSIYAPTLARRSKRNAAPSA